MNTLQLKPDLSVSFLGAPQEKGRLPAVFYFALSGQESLELDPYNQPAKFLENQDLRIFSLDLPAHGPDLNAIDAIGVWANEFSKGNDVLFPFLDNVAFAIHELIDRGLIIQEKVAFMGLSRGGLISYLSALRYPQVRAICLFAPMTKLGLAKEFHSLSDSPLVKKYDAMGYVDDLCQLPTRTYIGNRDIRVSTEQAYKLTQSFANAAFEKGVRSPPAEMIITPSIGQMGHGTSKESFESGALWVGKKLGVIHD